MVPLSLKRAPEVCPQIPHEFARMACDVGDPPTRDLEDSNVSAVILAGGHGG